MITGKNTLLGLRGNKDLAQKHWRICLYRFRLLACRYVEISQQPLLLVAEETNDKLRIIGVNDFKTCKIAEYSITNLYTDQTIYRGIAELPCRTATTVCEIDVGKNDKSFYLIKWHTNGKTYKNHFHTNIINVNFKKYLTAMKKAGYEFTEE